MAHLWRCLPGLLTLAAVGAQSLQLAATLGSHMVLQQAPLSACLYGTAAPGLGITVLVDGEEDQGGVSSSEGRWEVCLTPREAGGPHEVSKKSVAIL
jgi:hypothetical protein